MGKVVLFISLCVLVCVNTTVAIFFKLAAVDSQDHGLLAMVNPWFMGALAFLFLSFLLWTSLLRYWRLTLIQPFLALTFITIPAMSAWLFGENLSLRYWLGVAVLITGILLTAIGADYRQDD